MPADRDGGRTPKPSPGDRLLAPDPRLARRALELLGPLGDALAREALEHGEVTLVATGDAWEGSLGKVYAHRVVVRTAPELHAKVEVSFAARDALHQALAAAVAETPQRALVEIALQSGETKSPASGPYRG